MALDLLMIVVITSCIQSIFGVGVLLFGTPLLLLRGYGFIDTVTVLLPVSISINLIQIAKDYRSADFDLYKKILVYTIPFVAVFLFVVTKVQINVGLIVGAFLLIVAAKDYSSKVKRGIEFLVGYEKVYLIMMGILHGLTNLGGSLLTAIVHSKGYEKHITRVTIALSYATFAIFQILTLLVSGHRLDLGLSGMGIYLLSGVIVFIATERLVYKEINNKIYSKYFAVFLLLSGILLCIKSI